MHARNVSCCLKKALARYASQTALPPAGKAEFMLMMLIDPLSQRRLELKLKASMRLR